MHAVIFDMDGVLIDSERIVLDSFRYAGKITGVPDAERMAIIGLGLNDEAWMVLLRQEFGADADAVLKYSEEYMDRFYAANAAPAKKGALELLKSLHRLGVPTAVASSSPLPAVTSRLKKAELLPYFHAVISGDMVARSKPEPDIFLEAARRLGRPAQECFVIEDSPNGLRAGMAAGCHVLFVPDLWRPEEERYDLYEKRFENLDAVRAYFAQLQ